MPSVYIETTIPSYLTAWPTKNLIAESGFHVPIVCTPEELMGDPDETEE